ncbi:MAG: acetoin utilization deacetylase AcuC-like enzyme [Cyclobacteriaceae bacterium]|jgi:acetoin utilization deacetylase AcuC-like enzyme
MLKIALSDLYCHPLPENHRFPMEKYELLPRQLVHEGTVKDENFFTPTTLADEQILAVHTSEYLDKLRSLSLTKKEERRTGFPLSDRLVEREINIAAGTIQCADYALEHGVAMNIAGGTHHAYSDRGEGFCLLNDQAIASRYLLDTGKCSQVLIIDLDVHQGNGTAKIFSHEPKVFTFSMHGESNYPMHKEQSDLDVGLADGCEDQFYLSTLEANLNNIIESINPDFLFYQSGVDVLATDKLGRLGLSIEGCKARDKMVLKTAYELKIPIVVSMGGGYSENIKHIIEAHANTFRLAQEMFF